jgi:hypothetical protein
MMLQSTGDEAILTSGNSQRNTYRRDDELHNSTCNLHDSGFTADSSDTEQGASGTGWLGGMGTDFLNCLTENVSPVVSGVATLVHKTAVAVANEISQLERDGELEAEAAAVAERFDKDWERAEKRMGDSSSLNSSSSFDSNYDTIGECIGLPWEICQELSQHSTTEENNGEIPVYFTDKELMKKIFSLSRTDSTFFEPFSANSPEGKKQQLKYASPYSSNFVMNDVRIKLIQRIMDIDENLASTHARLTGGTTVNSSDVFFWKNYFFHCDKVRAEELRQSKQQKAKKKTASKWSRHYNKRKSILSASTKENCNVGIANGNDDDESLIPVESDGEEEQDDASSFVIQSPPNTGNSFTTTTSIDGDIVLVDTQDRFKHRN